MPLKSIWTSPEASAPTARTGRKGRIPTALAIPIPWKMSNKRCMVRYGDRVVVTIRARCRHVRGQAKGRDESVFRG